MSTIITNHTYAVNTLNAIITVIGDTRLPAPYVSTACIFLDSQRCHRKVG